MDPYTFTNPVGIEDPSQIPSKNGAIAWRMTTEIAHISCRALKLANVVTLISRPIGKGANYSAVTHGLHAVMLWFLISRLLEVLIYFKPIHFSLSAEINSSFGVVLTAMSLTERTVQL